MNLPITAELKKVLEVTIQGCINAYNEKEMGAVDHSIYDMYSKFSFTENVDSLIDTTRKVEGIIARRGKSILIIFQGSNGLADWADNFKFWKENEKYRKGSLLTLAGDIVGENISVKVHDGFHDQARLAYPCIKTAVDAYMQEIPMEEWDIIVTGHSLGGAVSTMTAFFLTRDFPEIRPAVTLVPHASPRVGNKTFVTSMNANVGRIVRTVFETDIVTRVPMEILGFRHVGIELTLKKRNRRWYDRILHPWTENVGSMRDHYPQNYRDAIAKLGVLSC